MSSVGNWINYIEFIFAIILLFFVIRMVATNKGKAETDKLLYSIVVSISLLLISDIIVVIFTGKTWPGTNIVMVVFNFLYFLSNYHSIWQMGRYAEAVARKNNGNPKKILSFSGNILFTISVAMLVVNLFWPHLYSIDTQNIYHRGKFFLIALLPAGLMLLILGLSLIMYRQYCTKEEQLTILCYVAFPIIAEGLQIMEPGFAWQPMAMAFSAFVIIVQNIVAKGHTHDYSVDSNINQEGKKLQTKIILFVCVVIVVFFCFFSRMAISVASDPMSRESEAHYQMLANKTTEQSLVWIVRETQILANQKASLEIINNFDRDFLSDYFANIITEYNKDEIIYDMYFVDTQNRMSAGSGYIQDPDIDFRERDWYVGALKSDSICYTNPYVDVDSGKFVITVSQKIYDKNGEIAGVLAQDIFVDTLFEIMEHQDLPEDSYLFIVDNEMGLVTHYNSEFGYIGDSPRKITDLNIEGYNELYDYLQSDQNEEPYIKIKDYDGITRCFFISKVEDCNWYVIAAISKQVIDESKSSLGKSIFISLIICLICGISLTLIATQNIIKKLTMAQETAKAANEAKSKFLANMSHEIRTPINAVLGMDEMLLRECKDDGLKEYARNIQSAGQALLGVVNDILDFSKIESDRLELVYGEYSYGELIGSCINLIQLRAQEKALEFRVERASYLPKTLYGDEIRIRQIISNLLTNAVKYTKEGSVTLYVGWENRNNNCGDIIIRVKDTGIGVKKENLDDLFTSFQRLDEKKNRNIEGTGLGLSITKQLVELMEGNISVDSEYGVGSEFSVVIPQQVINHDNTEEFGVHKEEEGEREIVLRTKNASILVVDDVPMNLTVVECLLKGSGLKVDTAQRGREAVQKILANRYDLVFLDHMMPEMDGIETIRYLKKNHADVIKNIPIVMLTANAIMGVQKMYEEEGFAGYLSKPISRSNLCKSIQQFLPPEKIAGEEEPEEQKTEETIDITETLKPVIHNSMESFQERIPGYNLKAALEYCNQNQEFLIEMLKEFTKNDLYETIQHAYQNQDEKMYTVKVHALKSTSLMLGLEKLSGEAKKLELASKEGNRDYVLENHDSVMRSYKEVINVITEVFG